MGKLDTAVNTPARNFDAADLVWSDGQASIVIVAPILSDFGKAQVPGGRNYLLVAVHHVDAIFLSQLSSGLLLNAMRIVPIDAPGATGAVQIPFAYGQDPAVAWLRWTPERDLQGLLGQMLPLALGALLAFAAAAVLVIRFVQRSERELVLTRHDADHDELTGLPNRRALTRGLEAAVAGCSNERPVHLLYMDLDRFKQVNDVWGHATGDEVIRTTAQRIAGIAGTESVGRFGGDEFVLFIEGCVDTDAIASDLLNRVRQPHDIAGIKVVLGGSIGIASAPAHCATAEELLRMADLALVRAKQLGKDRYVRFEPEMDHDSRLRHMLEKYLRGAIAKGEIAVHFQPILCSKTEAITGVEALARWHHPRLGLIPPGTFIAIAEDTGLIGPLDANVLRSACRAALPWGDLSLSVYISALQFRRPRFPEEVAAILAETGFPASRLKLELTETALIASAANIKPSIDQLRAMGIRLILDDFGTGYSSLSYLRIFALDGLKIDRSFVEDLDTAHDGYALLAAIVAMGHALGLEVTAEGIETDRQMVLARTAGCDELQGHLIGHAIDRERFAQLIPPCAGRTIEHDTRQAEQTENRG
jgi:diguanylate cyclase (GGDEF)-like protein